jgi:hypothetical protein
MDKTYTEEKIERIVFCKKRVLEMLGDEEDMELDDQEGDFSSRVAYHHHVPSAEFGAAVVAEFEHDGALGDVRRLVESG